MRSDRGAEKKARHRNSAKKNRNSSNRGFRYKPNPLRQFLFVCLALAGIGLGYGVGFLLQEKPEKPDAVGSTRSERETATSGNISARTVPPPLLPEDTKTPTDKPPRAYEEALPEDIIENAKILPPVGPDNEKPVAGKPVPPAAKPPTEVAVAVPKKVNRPRIAIVLDDLGIDKPRTARAIKLKGPLTLSFLTYANNLGPQTRAAREAGHELLIHIPMEPGSPDVDPGPNVLLTGIPRGELLTSLGWNLDQFSGYVGVNNHMGSRFTADLTGMEVVMEELKKRNLFFLDSITAGNSVGRKAARKVGVPFAARNVFLDHQDDVAGILKRLAEVEKLALKTGLAIAIGHPRESTLRALVPWLEKIEARGFQLVPLSQIVINPRSRGKQAKRP